MINCTGCKEPGVKFSHCTVCEIRNCLKAMGYDTCGDCMEMESCHLASGIHKHIPEDIMNLKNLN